MLCVHHANLHKSAEDDRVERLCLRHLHPDYRGPELPCSCATQIKGDLCRSGTTIQHRSLLRRPTYVQWLSHVLRLNCVMPSDRPMSNFPHHHSGREIGCEPHARLSVTCVRYGSRRAPSRWERWQALQEGRCYFPSLGLVHVCRRPLWFFSRTVAQAQESMCQRREVCRGSGIA